MTTLATRFNHKLLYDEPLAKYTAARLGGPAEMLYIARESTEELAEVVQAAWAEDMPVRVLGGGANVLVADSGLRGLVVINRVSDVSFGMWHGGRNVAASSGTGLGLVARKCQARGLSGMEWAISVPGTVGGAVVNNAGAHGSDMAASVRDVVVLEADGSPRLLTRLDLHYGYRYSTLKVRKDRRFIVLMVLLALQPDDPAAIEDRMHTYQVYRKRTQPPGASLGSIFKNPPGDYAGRLIESCGLKGYTIGGVMVSPVHANFFVTSGQATASDYWHLIGHVREVVQSHTGIALELEIEVLGEGF